MEFPVHVKHHLARRAGVRAESISLRIHNPMRMTPGTSNCVGLRFGFRDLQDPNIEVRIRSMQRLMLLARRTDPPPRVVLRREHDLLAAVTEGANFYGIDLCRSLFKSHNESFRSLSVSRPCQCPHNQQKPQTIVVRIHFSSSQRHDQKHQEDNEESSCRETPYESSTELPIHALFSSSIIFGSGALSSSILANSPPSLNPFAYILSPRRSPIICRRYRSA